MDNKHLNIIKIIKNKYVIVTIIFVVIFCFIDENNIFVTHKLQKEVNTLKQREAELQEGIKADSAQALALRNDLEAIERYGRQTYYMKRANEDIYIISHNDK